MNKLEEQIWDRYGNFELSHDKNKLIVDNINEFVQKHSIGFAEWLNINEYMLIDNIWFNLGHVTMLTTQELFKIYIENL
jgi:hypothetical protein